MQTKPDPRRWWQKGHVIGAAWSALGVGMIFLVMLIPPEWAEVVSIVALIIVAALALGGMVRRK